MKNKFSWSFSRRRMFEECKRKYYYYYYGSWGGWSTSADSETRLLYILKNLQTRHQWMGSVVHDVLKRIIDTALFGTRPLNHTLASTTLHNIMKRDFYNARSGKNHTDPKNFRGLFELEYDLPVPNQEWKRLYTAATSCIDAFFNSPFPDIINHLKYNDRLKIEQFDYFRHNTIKIFAVPDFIYKNNGIYTIIDWKTGSTTNYTDAKQQLTLYTAFTIDKWNTAINSCTAEIYNLLQQDNETFLITQQDIEETCALMDESIEHMRSLLDSVTENTASINRFARCDAMHICRTCFFYQLCWTDQVLRDYYDEDYFIPFA